MKKIDTWLDIQRFVAEAAQVSFVERTPDIELFAKPTRLRRRFKSRRLTKIKNYSL